MGGEGGLGERVKDEAKGRRRRAKVNFILERAGLWGVGRGRLESGGGGGGGGLVWGEGGGDFCSSMSVTSFVSGNGRSILRGRY